MSCRGKQNAGSRSKPPCLPRGLLYALIAARGSASSARRRHFPLGEQLLLLCDLVGEHANGLTSIPVERPLTDAVKNHDLLVLQALQVLLLHDAVLQRRRRLVAGALVGR